MCGVKLKQCRISPNFIGMCTAGVANVDVKVTSEGDGWRDGTELDKEVGEVSEENQVWFGWAGNQGGGDKD